MYFKGHIFYKSADKQQVIFSQIIVKYADFIVKNRIFTDYNKVKL